MLVPSTPCIVVWVGYCDATGRWLSHVPTEVDRGRAAVMDPTKYGETYYAERRREKDGPRPIVSLSRCRFVLVPEAVLPRVQEAL